MNFKLVVSDPKAKRAYSREVDQSASGLVGKRLGEVIAGDQMGLEGYKLEITGGSDRDGFPMRKDIAGTARKRVLLSSPPGFHPSLRGQRKRKSIRGNTVSADIAQINLKIMEGGKKTLEQIFGAKEKEAEKPKEGREKKAEGEKQEQKKETEKPKEEKPEAEHEEKGKPAEEEKKSEKPETKHEDGKEGEGQRTEKAETKHEERKEEKPKEEKAEKPAQTKHGHEKPAK